MMIRFCLIGADHIGQIHAKSLAQIQDTELAVAVDFSSKASEDLASQYDAKIMSINEAVACHDHVFNCKFYL